MRYILTEKQFSKLIEQETTQQTSVTSTPSTGSTFEYGKQMKVFSGETSTGGTQSNNTTGNITAKLYYDKEQKKPTPANYVVSKMTKLNDGSDGLEINLGSFSINTDCAKILSGDNSFRYRRENKTFYSSDLANKVKDHFKCS